MIRILHGDCRDVLKTLPEASVDSIVCDPPYDLTAGKKGGSGAASVNLDSPYGRARIGTGNGSGGFMGMAWDGTGVAFDPETWRQALRVLKPGGHLLAFGGTRTYHRMVCAIEDAGFEIRDQIGWAYGSGFPKSLNGPWGGTALKPAWEPICMARKRLIGTVEANVLQHGTGALNIDGCRVGMSQVDREFILKTARPNSAGQEHDGTVMNRPRAPTVNVHDLGRWPANLIHDGSDEVLAAFPQAPGQLADGSAARFFFCSKASKSDRGEGNTHQTVKPTDLMRYLCRLVTPPGGIVLDPFMGSGSTLRAAELEGFSAIGIELSAEYVEIARRRIAADAPLFAEVAVA